MAYAKELCQAIIGPKPRGRFKMTCIHIGAAKTIIFNARDKSIEFDTKTKFEQVLPFFNTAARDLSILYFPAKEDADSTSLLEDLLVNVLPGTKVRNITVDAYDFSFLSKDAIARIRAALLANPNFNSLHFNITASSRKAKHQDIEVLSLKAKNTRKAIYKPILITGLSVAGGAGAGAAYPLYTYIKFNQNLLLSSVLLATVGVGLLAATIIGILKRSQLKQARKKHKATAEKGLSSTYGTSTPKVTALTQQQLEELVGKPEEAPVSDSADAAGTPTTSRPRSQYFYWDGVKGLVPWSADMNPASGAAVADDPEQAVAQIPRVFRIGA